MIVNNYMNLSVADVSNVIFRFGILFLGSVITGLPVELVRRIYTGG